MRDFTKCHFLKSLSAVVSIGPIVQVIIQHHFILDLTLFGTTKVSDKPLESSAFQTIISPKMIWTFGTTYVCGSRKSEIGHWIYKQAKRSCWKWSIKPYVWLVVGWTVLSLIVLNSCLFWSTQHQVCWRTCGTRGNEIKKQIRPKEMDLINSDHHAKRALFIIVKNSLDIELIHKHNPFKKQRNCALHDEISHHKTENENSWRHFHWLL